MIEVNPWWFLLLVFSAAGGYMGLVLYVGYWWMHKRPQKPSPVPPPPSRIVLP